MACSGGSGADQGAANAAVQAALKTCAAFFGEDNVATVRSGLGEIDVASRSVDSTKDELLKDARAWRAESDDLKRTSYRPCQLRDVRQSEGNLAGTVKWSQFTMEFVSKGADASEWHKASDGVYVKEQSLVDGRAVVMVCTVPGTAPGQGKQLPLEVRLRAEGLDDDGGGLSGRLLASLARNTRSLVGCQETLAIPDTL
ncbi:hypothetical protein KV205_30725 [Streptomyces sp. SKN60]|uniref:hypothetical protein n=1 Tax=Streptomyces sp. SKN60 TaxID=2855506 RepID=UPI002245D7CE|nr:hypothetical protein [Streptomyces sp. SKN60]MCX2184870.1 hypothetical protein [Streptomyces sp. SKN60]